MSLKVLKNFAYKCSNADLGVILFFFSGKVKFVFHAFIWEELINTVK